MPYATAQDLVDRFGEQEVLELTDRNNLGVIDAAVVALALADADAEIDSYLSRRYRLPIASAPQALVRVACDLARYRLYAARATDEVRGRYKDAVRFLESVAADKVSLGLDPAGAEPATAGGAQIVGDGRIFGRNESGDFI